MKIRKGRHAPDKVEMQMTPMIDVVFQLLIFFILTFKISVAEGDFNIKMPASAPSNAQDVPLPPIKVRMTANPDGSLASLSLGDRALTNFDALRQEIVNIVGVRTGPGSSLADELEVELDCDYNLHYENVIRAVTATSGMIEGGQVIKLIEKIKFAPPRAAE